MRKIVYQDEKGTELELTGNVITITELNKYGQDYVLSDTDIEDLILDLIELKKTIENGNS